MYLLKILPVILVVFVSGCAAQVNETTTQPQEQEATQPTQPIEKTPTQPTEGTLQGEVTSPQEEISSIPPLPAVHTIEITSAGFTPSTLTIKSGDIVKFINKDVALHWPASDIHPTHGIYPEKGGCISSKFDACKGLKQGESYEFTFLHGGKWCFHDHLNPGLTGCVDVK